jgi:hypothetical protein
MTVAARISWWDYYGLSIAMLLTPLVLGYICMAVLLPITIRSFLMWRRARSSQSEAQTKEVQKHESWYNPGEEDRIELHNSADITAVQPCFSQDRYFDVKSTASSRPLSSVADWSSVSGATTLTQAPSVRSSGTKRPPSYASPLPSRAPTTIYRKPVNGS